MINEWRPIAITQTWGTSVLGTLHAAPGACLRVGEQPGVDFLVPGLRHVLFRDGWLDVGPFRGEVLEGDSVLPLSEWVARRAERAGPGSTRVRLADGVRMRLQSGGTTLLVERTDPVHAIAGDGPLDRVWAGTVVAVLATAVGVAWLGGGAEGASGDDLHRVPDDLAGWISLPAPTPTPEPAWAHAPAAAPTTAPIAGGSAQGAPGSGEEGTTGKGSSPAPAPDGHGVLDALDPDLVATAFGSGRQLEGDLGPLVAAGPGGPGDGRGTGIRGDGPGGGGIRTLPGFGKDGWGPGAGGEGRRPGRLPGGRDDASITLATEDVLLQGLLDPSVVEEAIRRHLPQIRHCYERRLALLPALGGKLLVAFTIEADGYVGHVGIAQDTLGDPETAACVRERFAKIRFAAPKGGGIVAVRFPLLFESAGR